MKSAKLLVVVIVNVPVLLAVMILEFATLHLLRLSNWMDRGCTQLSNWGRK